MGTISFQGQRRHHSRQVKTVKLLNDVYQWEFVCYIYGMQIKSEQVYTRYLCIDYSDVTAVQLLSSSRRCLITLALQPLSGANVLCYCLLTGRELDFTP